MREYIDGHRFSQDVATETVERLPLLTVEVDGEKREADIDDAQLRQALEALYVAVIDLGSQAALFGIEANKERGIVPGPLADDMSDD